MTNKRQQQLTQQFRALGNPKRFSAWLEVGKRKGGLFPYQIQEILGIESTLLSHHLRTLRESGLLLKKQEGKRVRYTAKEAIFDLKIRGNK